MAINSLAATAIDPPRYQLIIAIGAGNETRTRDPNHGKVVLYQLSYSRARRHCTYSLTFFSLRQQKIPALKFGQINKLLIIYSDTSCSSLASF